MELGATTDFDVTTLRGRRADNRWDRVCIGDLVERVTWSTPDKAALIGWDGAYADGAFRELTYRGLDALINQAANALIAAGVEPGDRILMICENSVEAYVAKLGAARMGAAVAPVNPAMAGDMLSHVVGVLQPRLTIVDAEFVPRVAATLAGLAVGVDVTIEIGGAAADRSLGFSEFVAGQPETEPDVRIHGDDICELLFTSGATAMPKGVMLSHTSGTLAAHGFALSLTRGLEVETHLRLVTFLPMIYHVGHLVFMLPCFATGGTVVLGRRPDAAAAAEAVERERATALWGGSPAMMAAFSTAAATGGRDISSLTVAIYGWAALPPAVLDEMQQQAPRLTVAEIFGQTEAIACHRFWPSQDPEIYRETAPQDNNVGRPSPLLASRIISVDDEWLEGTVGQPGEVVYRSPVVTAGYYKDPTATAAAFRSGWFHSGDCCAYDAGGRRIMLDRFKDIVKTGGENVSTIRVESVLVQHPKIAKAAVIGLADDRWGEVVTAVVVPADDTLTEDEVIAFARTRLAGYESPKRVVIVDALPETVGGKIMKYRLRQSLGEQQ
ncbi:MAG: AMP-binding protein [Tetrasphaera sp.]